MPPKGLNRFALLGDQNSPPSPKSSQVVRRETLSQPSPAVQDDTWQMIDRSGQQARKVATLRIRTENKLPVSANNRDIRLTREISFANAPAHSPVDPNKAPNGWENWCGVCNVYLPDKAAMQVHIKQKVGHHHYCNLCKRVFKDRNGLQNHVDNSLGHEVSCNVCLSAFNDKWGLYNHFLNNFSPGHGFACMTMACLLAFNSQRELDRHLGTSKVHVWCQTCHRKFKDQYERDEHYKKTTKHKHCLQSGCEYDAETLAQLEKHLMEDHFTCQGCHISFPSRTRLTLHTSECGLRYTCGNCGNLFSEPEALHAHERECLVCQQCGFATEEELAYLTHMTTHVKSADAVQCWLCNKLMSTQTLLIKHLETGKCASLSSEHELLTRVLGAWHRSVLYMDKDIHEQLRTNAIEPKGLMVAMKDGLNPYICRLGARPSGCGKTFNRFSGLVYHLENGECTSDWRVDILWLQELEKAVKASWRKEDMWTIV